MYPKTKPGYKTTEFWLSLGAILIGALWASGVVSPDGTDALSQAVGVAAATLGAMGYSIARGMAKHDE
jgi:hypothetical protein